MDTYRFQDPMHNNVIVEHDDGRVSGFGENSERWYRMVADGITPTNWVDPRTPQQIYDEDVLAPTDAVMLSPRLIEELYDWAVNGVALPDASKTKFGPLVADRKAKRAARS